jgi:hypothetical protein
LHFTDDSVTCCTGLAGDDGLLRINQPVKQARFANISLTDDSDGWEWFTH